MDLRNISYERERRRWMTDMKMASRPRNKSKGIVCVILAVMMAFSSVTVPQRTQAAVEKNFSGTGKSTVSISDAESYQMDLQKPITHYIKFKAGVTGYITLKFVSDSKLLNAKTGERVMAEGDITLCDSKKSPIGVMEAWYSKKAYTGDNARTYGVLKGKTYYFKVESWGGVKISANVVKVAKSSANSKAKAKNLAMGKSAKGVMIAGQKKSDWYKVKLTKGAKLKIEYTAKTMGYADAKQYGYQEAGLRFTFVMNTKDGKWTAKTDLTPLKPNNSVKITMRDEKYGTLHNLPAGTYYVKVEPINKKSSGYYTLKWTTYS